MELLNIKNWIFDLDNTLYSPEEEIFSQIDERMTTFITDKFKVDDEEAFNIQKKYFLEYGTTLSGLMKKNNIDPDEFLEFVHDIDLSILEPNKELNEIISGLPGKKFIFTNGSKKHAENVLRKLEMNKLFDDIFDIKDSNFIPKPNKDAYVNFIRKMGIDTKHSIMFEDIARNLQPAKDLGIISVLIKRDIPLRNSKYKIKEFESLWANNDFADYITDDLVMFFNKYYKETP
ncbi:MAG: pyrimidine 5'-nucleotidase [Pseudomonadota bacterium]|nr:pyrimidine 5'-nucleotidase [Pseudomonadota bacterium]